MLYLHIQYLLLREFNGQIILEVHSMMKESVVIKIWMEGMYYYDLRELVMKILPKIMAVGLWVLYDLMKRKFFVG